MSEVRQKKKTEIDELLDSDIVDITHSVEEKLISSSSKIDTSVVFLTYVCDNSVLTSKDIFDNYYRHGYDGILVVDEFTKNKKIHHHVLLVKEKRVTIRNIYMFDFMNEHAYIRYGKKTDIGKIIDYCMKGRKTLRDVPDGLSKVQCYGIDPRSQSHNNNYRTVHTKYLDAIAEESETFEEASSKLGERGVPVRDHALALAYLKKKFPEKNEYYFKAFKYKPEDFEYVKELLEFFDNYVFIPDKYDRYPILVIYGPTKRQKTSFIRALGPHLYFKGSVDPCAFANIPSDCKFVVMDDIKKDEKVNILSNNSLMLGQEDGWATKFNYIGIKRVENVCPVIWICNQPDECFINPNDSTYQEAGYYYSNSWVIHIARFTSKFWYKVEKEIINEVKKGTVIYNERENIDKNDGALCRVYKDSDYCSEEYVKEYDKDKIIEKMSEVLPGLDRYVKSVLDLKLKGLESGWGFDDDNTIHHISDQICGKRAEQKGSKCNKKLMDDVKKLRKMLER